MADRFRDIWQQDLAVAKHKPVNKGGLLTLIHALLSRSAFAAVFLYRLSALCFARGGLWRKLGYFIARLNAVLHACDIDPAMQAGPGLHLPHPVGVVMGGARLGCRVTIMQNVTLGTSNPLREIPLTDDLPCLGDDVFVGAGAVILGDIYIGPGARVGAGSVVLESVPSGALAVGVPARVKGQEGGGFFKE